MVEIPLSELKKWEKWIMITEYAVDSYILRKRISKSKAREDRKLKTARAYIWNLRTQIRRNIGFSQSTLPTIIDFHNRKTIRKGEYFGYIRRLAIKHNKIIE